MFRIDNQTRICYNGHIVDTCESCMKWVLYRVSQRFISLDFTPKNTV